MIDSYPMEHSVVQDWLKRWWPSQRMGNDPLHSLLIEERYVPVTVANWKLTPRMRDRVLAARVPCELTFTRDARLTVVIPYRDRDAHLRELAPVLQAKLDGQGLTYRILVVEQPSGEFFNRGRLINVGMHFASEHSDYYCIHDADAIPVDANYLCPSQPLRLVNWIESESGTQRREPYYFSGAVSIRKEQAFAANGFSNDYWGWGKEDDDFFFRLLLANFVPFFDSKGKFLDLPNPSHQQVVRTKRKTPPHLRANRRRRSELLRGLADPARDGLSTLRYEVEIMPPLYGCERILVRWNA